MNYKFREGETGEQNNIIQDPKLFLTMLVLFSRPGMEQQLEQAITMLEGISNTIRTLRQGADALFTSLKEAQQQMLTLPKK
ncbi:hypothetical protein JOC37_001039 [Desulfohalotomaculum tongense]|uniref:hypothetical protein n=1 Tax=Desulforadius tongensis TaxID=1216062 RepID=UPI00195E947A|nr:hypothetical protein [Desulforadius tongensis]MBM7854661.1 hypothetical protein [Desulforadius tongensis]